MMRQIILYSVFVTVLFSCSKSNEKELIISELKPFSEVDLGVGFNLTFEEDAVYSIEISGYKNRLKKVSFGVENGILRIRNTDKNRWLHPKKKDITVHIKSLPLKKISAGEGCRIESLSPITSNEFGLILYGKSNEAKLRLNCPTFYYWNNFPCGGKLELMGQAKLVKIWNVGLLQVDGKNLTTEVALIENSSKADCSLHVTDFLHYQIRGSGNIQLYGNPTVELTQPILGTGTLIRN